ncbi:calmodulin-like protein 4 isoform X2 [Clavelina lepadiformis]|uniref:calmodulin-like protein 4 isoform X2 n=1 Tax=Clavelina lepadiformis TaxID=159417 RepID=UPI004042660E
MNKTNFVTDLRDCFNLYDKQHNGRILCSDLITVMRSLGASPTLRELKLHLQELKKGKTDYLDFSQFLKIWQKQMSKENITNEITEALKLTDDSNKGLIAASELRRILMNTGEKLSHKEVDQIFRAANVRNNGYIKYKDFVTMVTIPIPDY